MLPVNQFITTMLAMTICCASCSDNNDQSNKNVSTMETENLSTLPPKAEGFIKSPLRNQVKLELNSPVSQVWELVGDPARMPEYSEGLQRVKSKKDSTGRCFAFTCYFKPLEAGGKSIVHEFDMLWYEPNIGWASLDLEPNSFNLEESLNLVTLEPQGNKTILNWLVHFNCATGEMVRMNVSAIEQALNIDITQRLVQKFGGRILESYVDGK